MKKFLANVPAPCVYKNVTANARSAVANIAIVEGLETTLEAALVSAAVVNKSSNEMSELL